MDPKLLEDFKVRLAQTIHWCQRHVDASNPRSCLRTTELRPRLLEENRFSSVDFVGYTRELHGGAPIRHAEIPANLGGGRLMVYFPNDDLACGAAEQETDGFFDVNNVPPWDTWVAFLKDGRSVESYDTEYLVAWVPSEFVELAEQGMNVNPEQCIQWLTDTPLELLSVLRREKLIA